jgi:hypothetical protein
MGFTKFLHDAMTIRLGEIDDSNMPDQDKVTRAKIVACQFKTLAGREDLPIKVCILDGQLHVGMGAQAVADVEQAAKEAKVVYDPK